MVLYYIFKKSWHILHNKLLYEMGQDLLDIQYAGAVALVIIITLDMYTALRRHKCISSLHLVSNVWRIRIQAFIRLLKSDPDL